MPVGSVHEFIVLFTSILSSFEHAYAVLEQSYAVLEQGSVTNRDFIMHNF